MCKTDTEKLFSLVEASKLSLDDAFMQHEPTTRTQAKFEKRLEAMIRHGLKDFYAPRLDPSIDVNGNIFFRPGSKPGVGKPAIWWLKNAPKYMAGCRMGTATERDAFLATLIKRKLATWEQICDHSEEIGHYLNSKGAKHGLETTGSRPLGEFCDLANTYKITLSEDEQARDFSLVGGYYNCGNDYPLAFVHVIFGSNHGLDHGVGWLVIDV